MAAVSPYSTALALGRPKPSHVKDGTDNLDRVTAYATYEDIWNNVPEAFAALLRLEDDPKARRYVPVVRGLVEAINRYMAVDPEITWIPIPGAEVDEETMNAFTAQVNDLLIREEFGITLLGMKRWWLIKGDGLLALSADPSKEQGKRLRITEVTADQYFPIWDPTDSTRVLGVYLAAIVQDDEDEDIIQRIEYQRIMTQEDSAKFNGAPIGSIFYRIGYYELDGWDDRIPDPQDLKTVDPPSWVNPGDGEFDPLEGYSLPAQITTIPIYHFRNNRRGGMSGRYGVSEIQGLETLLAGSIQNSTDEDMTVALMGIGVYWTDSGRPRDAAGRETDWTIAPGTVLELEKDGKFGKVEGVGSVQPIQDHLTYLKGEARDAMAVPAVAAGSRPSVNESGVALRIEFMPVLAKNAEKEEELASRLSHLLYDLAYMWLPAYEGVNPPMVQPNVLFGDPLPLDRAAALKEILDMVTARVVSVEWAQGEIAAKLGYKFPADMLGQIVSEQEQMLDATGQRIDDAATSETF